MGGGKTLCAVPGPSCSTPDIKRQLKAHMHHPHNTNTKPYRGLKAGTWPDGKAEGLVAPTLPPNYCTAVVDAVATEEAAV